MKKFLISAVPPSTSGVGRLMAKLVPEAKERGFRIIVRKKRTSVKSLIKRLSLIALLAELFERYLGRLIFMFRINIIRNARVLFLHPQSTGFNNLFRLIKYNEIYFYVVDNSFFCIRSRNVDPIHQNECLRCLKSPTYALPECHPHPKKIMKEKNIEYLLKLKEVSGRLKFLAQNKNQASLLKNFYGSDIWVKIVGLDTGELTHLPFSSSGNGADALNNNIISFDFVFHGAPLLEKGLDFFIKLAESMPVYTFFIPASKKKCEEVINRPVISQNITFKSCTWETGLKDIVMQSKFVVTPSLWSAPIEGAFIKSLFFNGNVITVATEYGFEEELSHQSIIYRLPVDPKDAAKQLINDLVLKEKLINGNLKDWIMNFQKNNCSSDVFYEIENLS